jgi:hypothetical protein
MSRKILSLTALGFTLFIWACTNNNVEDDVLPDPPTGNLCDTVPSIVSFSDTILPIIERYCSDPNVGSGCHAAGQRAPFLVDYTSIKGQVDFGRMRARVLDRNPTPMPPAGEATLTECERILLDRWMKDGALNN